MPDILHDFPIRADTASVFDAISTPAELDQWWTKRSSGRAETGAEYELWFGPEYDWRGRVTRCVRDRSFELEITRSHDDWRGTRVQFELQPTSDGTQLHFAHVGWPDANEHYRTSCYCWAMYLRVLRRYLEFGRRCRTTNGLTCSERSCGAVVLLPGVPKGVAGLRRS